MTLRRPDGIPDKYWKAIEAYEKSLDVAVQMSDLSRIVGGAKDLCESVARVICEVQAQTVSASDNFERVIAAAHAALDRLPGRGSAVEADIRQIAQSAKTIVTKLAPLRNELGTGHGRSTLPIVTREIAAMSEQAARLWTTWALARLDEVMRGEVPRLVQELEGGSAWKRGLLAERFSEVGLDSLHSEDQHRLGVAVAHRSSVGGTFVVREAGVEPLNLEATSWPAHYRAGVASGLLIDSRGRFALRQPYVHVLSVIVGLMEVDQWRILSDQVVNAPLDPELGNDPEMRLRVAESMNAYSNDLDELRRKDWLIVKQRIEQAPVEIA